MKLLQIILGCLLILSSLWFGSYFIHEFPIEHWANFPIYMTALGAFIGGSALIITAV